MTESEPRLCIDRELPLGLDLTASQLAVAENPANAKGVSMHDLPAAIAGSVGVTAGITKKFWKPGRVLRVRFLDGNETVQTRLQPFAHIWSQYSNISFQFGSDPDAEIRVTFKLTGSWSYIGTDALALAKDQPTMNFGWLTPTTGNDEYSRVVTHEFGHALGLIHEHQNPVTDIPWNKQAVYDYYQGPPNNWSKSQVDVNLFQRYSKDVTTFTEFDRKSIMLYPIPAQFLTDPKLEVGWNKTLSELDKKFVASIYPHPPKVSNELTIDGPAISASIDVFGEVDAFTFTVAKAGRYRVETDGRLDTTVSLFGPNDPARFIAKDDDSGFGLNARVVQQLQPGQYTVTVRHYNPKRTGDYQISVAKA